MFYVWNSVGILYGFLNMQLQSESCSKPARGFTGPWQSNVAWLSSLATCIGWPLPSDIFHTILISRPEPSFQLPGWKVIKHLKTDIIRWLFFICLSHMSQTDQLHSDNSLEKSLSGPENIALLGLLLPSLPPTIRNVLLLISLQSDAKLLLLRQPDSGFAQHTVYGVDQYSHPSVFKGDSFQDTLLTAHILNLCRYENPGMLMYLI